MAMLQLTAHRYLSLDSAAQRCVAATQASSIVYEVCPEGCRSVNSAHEDASSDWSRFSRPIRRRVLCSFSDMPMVDHLDFRVTPSQRGSGASIFRGVLYHVQCAVKVWHDVRDPYAWRLLTKRLVWRHRPIFRRLCLWTRSHSATTITAAASNISPV